MANDFDVIIIGSGAGAAPIAHTLTRAGKSVLVLEKGPLLLPQTESTLSEFKRDELFATGPEKRIDIPGMANTGSSYYSSHVEPDLNDEPHVYREGDGQDNATIEGYTAQVVGGGTQLYGAVSLRFTPEDFALATFNHGRNINADTNGDVQREALDWPISYDDLEPYYCRTEALIGINGGVEGQLKRFSEVNYQRPLPPNPISDYARTGMELLGQEYPVRGRPVLPYRTPLAVITQDHAPSGRKAGEPRTSYVNRYGDPLGLKSNTWSALLAPISKEPNFQLWPNCVVTELRNRNEVVTDVVYRDPAGRERVVSGKVVVVACSAIESVRLLQLSAALNADFARRINRSGLLGAYFLTHCFGGAETTVPRRFDKSISLDSDWATDVCASVEYLNRMQLWAGAAIYNNTSDQALPISMARTHGSQDLDTIWRAFVDDMGITGEGMLGWLDDTFGRRLSVSFMANQVPLRTNRVELHPTVRDKWGRPVAYIVKEWHQHDRYLMDTLAEECAKVLRIGIDPVNRNWPVEGKGGVYMASNSRARIANHILGGARFGSDATDSILDPSCKAWGFDNLYVTDGSFMPTSGSANPTNTIEANAFRVADIILQRI